MTLRLAILVSGRGSNLAAVRRSIEHFDLDASIELVLCNHLGAAALAHAEGLPVAVIPRGDFPTRAQWDVVLTEAVCRAEPDLVVLAGFDRLVGPPLLEAYPDRVVNLHPSLLPAFPGQHAVRDALAHGVAVSGTTLHLADFGLDTGPIIAQAAVPVYLSDTEDTLSARIREREHVLLVEVLGHFARGAVKVLRLAGDRPRVLSPSQAPPR